MHYALEVQRLEARAEAANEYARRDLDGAHHPHFESEKVRIPVSTAEKMWLFQYFEALGAQVKAGNYYKFVICFCYLVI